MIVQHLTREADFQLDPERTVYGWGVKNCAPCEALTGCLYVTDDACKWTHVLGVGDGRNVVVFLELGGVEGEDYHVLSERETLVVNLAALTVLDIVREEA